jgi:hypothetical protein
MTRMRRAAAVSLLVLALLSAACTRTAAPPPTSSPHASSPPPTSPTITPATPVPPSSPTATPVPAKLRLPADAPTTFARPLDPDQVPTAELLAPGAQVTATWTMTPPRDPIALIALAWARGSDPFSQEHGFVVWERLEGQSPPWRAVYAFTDPAARGILAVQLSEGDLTHDGIDDVLTFEDAGGSGACGTWRVIAPSDGSAEQIYHQPTCDTQIVNTGGSLKVQQAVYQPGDAHCCPSSYLLSTLRWDGSGWRVQASRSSPGPSG